MNDGASTSAIYDSTDNNNDGTKKAANEPIEGTGKVGQGQDFDGTDDYIDVADITADVNTLTVVFTNNNIFSGECTKETFLNITGDYGGLRIGSATGGLTNEIITMMSPDYRRSGWCSAVDTVSAAAHIVTTVWNGSEYDIYLDNDKKTITKVGTPELLSGDNIRIGLLKDGSGCFDGTMSEIRISSTSRSAAWIKATYNSLWDRLFTYGAQETSGVVDNAIFFGFNF